MRVAIIGAGAMGCLWAARLHAAGHDVALLTSNSATLAAARERGVRLSSVSGPHISAAVRTTNDPAGIGITDVTFVWVKAQGNTAVLPHLRWLTGPRTTVVGQQNGWGNAEVLSRACDAHNLVIGVTYHSARIVGPAEVAHTYAGETFIGPYLREGSLSQAEQVAEMQSAAGLGTTVTPDAGQEIWKKLVMAAAVLPVGALTHLTAGGLGSDDAILALIDGIAAETASVARALGYEVDLQERLERVHAGLAAGGQGRGSMSQDVAAGRTTEIEAISGAVVREAERRGIPVPLSKAMLALIQGVERSSAT